MPTPSSLALVVSPHGVPHVEPAEAEPTLDSAVQQRLLDAFARGPGAALLHLGAAEVDTPLPAGLAWGRALGHAFMNALRALPDLEQHRGSLDVAVPAEDLDTLAQAVPPLRGAEYVSPALLQEWWSQVQQAAEEELGRFKGSAEEWLHSQHPAWHAVGRVCLHLAENKRDPECPFAFLATYATRLSAKAQVQYRPLGNALTEYAGARNKEKLLALLEPVQRASEHSPLVKQLMDAGDLFHPLRWSAQEAYHFLREVPALEQSGVVVRVPDWWSARKPPRPQVSVTVGSTPRRTLDAATLLDFDVQLTLDGQKLSAAEWKEILKSTAGLALVRGRWVEVDPEKLKGLLDQWQHVQKGLEEGGLSVAEGLRLLSGVRTEDSPAADLVDHEGWTGVQAGPWLEQVLSGLRGPEGLEAVDPGKALQADLRPYQSVGLRWLWMLNRLGLGACLADDMGLGKTVQVIALMVLLRKHKARGPHLLVVPASLLANWHAEIARFAPGLRAVVAHPSVMSPEQTEELAAGGWAGVDAVLTTYGTVTRAAWTKQQPWGLVVLDEAQAIKNPGTKQSRAVKELHADQRLALTGTPVENRLGDLWSLFDFLNPGLLGSAKSFTRVVKGLENNYGPLRQLVRPYILRRLKTDRRILPDLPDKTEVRAFCALSKTQAALYAQAVRSLAEELRGKEGMERRGLVLAYLMRFKQICNHPSHWLRDGSWKPEDSGKLDRLAEIADTLSQRGEKALVFTQFREVTDPLARFLEGVFGRPGLVLHGEVAVKKRQELVRRFQEEEDLPFMVLSLKAGGTGLNLTAASHVVHFDRWWNPAVEDQATDRAFRIGQKRNVLVHKFVCRGTVEERIDALMSAKADVSRQLLEDANGAEVLLTEMSNDDLLKLVSLDAKSALGEG